MNLYWKRFVIVLLCGSLFIISGCKQTDATQSKTDVEPEQSIGLEIGDIPPDTMLVGINGEQMMLSDLKGKKVFLNFWATWCPPCREEMPAIEQMQKKYGDDLIIVAVSSMESKATVTQFLESNPYTFPIYLDEKGKLSKTYQLLSIPTSYFINEKGIIQNKAIGSMTFEKMESYYQGL